MGKKKQKKETRKSRFCTSIIADSPDEMARKASLALSLGSNLVEFRIDRLEGGNALNDIGRKLSPFARKAILTVRSSEEGGGFKGSEGARLELISRLAEMKPAYVDIELATAKENENWLESLPKSVETIISWHNFTNTPDEPQLIATCEEALSLGSLAKVVTTATKVEDNIATLALCRRGRGRVMSFCMGELGALSRVLSMRMDAPIVYTALPNEAVAPGQLSISTMRKLRSMIA
jgi:3-dehydroquinate dehydratase type I